MAGSYTTLDRLPQPQRGIPSSEIASVVRHLGGELLRSRLLLIYGLLGVASGLVDGPGHLVPTLFNYLVLLPLYVLVIYHWTGNAPPLAASTAGSELEGTSRPLSDLALVVTLFLANLGATVWIWSGGLPLQVVGLVQSALKTAGWDQSLVMTVSNGVESTLFALVPSLVIVLVLFRLRPSQVGLIPRRLGLGLVLVVIGIGLAYLLKLVYGVTPTPLLKGLEFVPLAIVLFCAQAFVNGLLEEFVFRGVMLSRLLAWLRNPHHVLVLTSILFVAMHIPSHLAQPTGAPWWTLVPFSPGYQPTGLVWGYLFYRTRSIWPGVLWHTSYGTLGLVFLG